MKIIYGTLDEALRPTCLTEMSVADSGEIYHGES